MNFTKISSTLYVLSLRLHCSNVAKYAQLFQNIVYSSNRKQKAQLFVTLKNSATVHKTTAHKKTKFDKSYATNVSLHVIFMLFTLNLSRFLS